MITIYFWIMVGSIYFIVDKKFNRFKIGSTSKQTVEKRFKQIERTCGSDEVELVYHVDDILNPTKWEKKIRTLIEESGYGVAFHEWHLDNPITKDLIREIKNLMNKLCMKNGYMELYQQY